MTASVTQLEILMSAPMDPLPSWDKDGYFRVLGLTYDATTAEITRSYRQTMLLFHTDRHVGKSGAELEQMNEMSKRLTVAKDVLTDDQKRADYERGMDLSQFVYQYDWVPDPEPVAPSIPDVVTLSSSEETGEDVGPSCSAADSGSVSPDPMCDEISSTVEDQPEKSPQADDCDVPLVEDFVSEDDVGRSHVLPDVANFELESGSKGLEVWPLEKSEDPVVSVDQADDQEMESREEHSPGEETADAACMDSCADGASIPFAEEGVPSDNDEMDVAVHMLNQISSFERRNKQRMLKQIRMSMERRENYTGRLPDRLKISCACGRIFEKKDPALMHLLTRHATAGVLYFQLTDSDSKAHRMITAYR